MTNSERVTLLSVAFMGASVAALAGLHFLEWMEHHLTVRPDKVGK